MATLYSLTPLAADPLSVSSALLGAFAASERPYLIFPDVSARFAHFTVAWPRQVSGTPSATVSYCTSAVNTGTVRFVVYIEAIGAGDSIVLSSTSSFDAANSNGGTVPGTAGHPGAVSIALTNIDSAIGGDMVRIRLGRDPEGVTGTDDLADNALVELLEIHDEG